FLFGFSRGAYTVRSIAGMVRKCGILTRKSVGEYVKAIALYRSPVKPTDPEAVEFRAKYSICEDQPIAIRMIGVWDTVGALGIPLRGLRWLTRRDHTFHDVALSRSVEHAYHALAIDEHRKPFLPTLWRKQEDSPDQKVQQVWFAGAHSDVGGGYKERGLSDVALGWMMERATVAGLAFDTAATAVRPLQPNHQLDVHDSRTILYRVVPGVDREIGRCPVDPAKPEGESQLDPTQSLHPTVMQRWRDCPQWRPRNLAKYLDSDTGGGAAGAMAPVGS
ncbi:MAG TPA: DUF2235 domain-containing protein, partial [Thermoanaerobaculia bacterium]|nr:DUF2235 domain-containing protein [Thermoanaerobaculia bacterium]